MRQETVWTFRDLGFFLGAILPAYLIAAVVTSWIGPGAWHDLAFQTVLYLLLIGALAAQVRAFHGVSLQEATSWRLGFRGVWWCVFLAPVFALAGNVLMVLMKAPILPTPLDELTVGSVPLPVVSVFAVMLGPLFEELVFRGFLQPLLQARWGPRLGLLATAAAFSSLHGPNYQWHWQYLLVLFLAGLAFGVARHLTGSTAAAFLLHMGYNLTQFTATVAQQQL